MGRFIKRSSDGKTFDVDEVVAEVYDESNRRLKTSSTVQVGDIEIGAVEIKDHDGTNRVEVTAANALKAEAHQGTAANLKATVTQEGNVNIGDVSAGTQTNDIKVTLDSETVQLTIPSGINGAPVIVGTTAVEMTFTGTTKSISLMSDADNTGKIWWGPSSIDNTGANAFGRLTPDRAVTIEFDDSSTAIYCCSDTASQKIFKVCLT